MLGRRSTKGDDVRKELMINNNHRMVIPTCTYLSNSSAMAARTGVEPVHQP